MGVDGISVRLRKSSKTVRLDYTLLAKELSVRSNHLDATHLHLMPPFTWFWPERGIDNKRLELKHGVDITAPLTWTPATQLNLDSSEDLDDASKQWHFSTEGRDLVLDSIIEVNPNPTITQNISGRPHHLKWWDSGGHQPDSNRLQAFIDDMERIAKEHYALFGVPDCPDYTTVLHLTFLLYTSPSPLDLSTSRMPSSA